MTAARAHRGITLRSIAQKHKTHRFWQWVRLKPEICRLGPNARMHECATATHAGATVGHSNHSGHDQYFSGDASITQGIIATVSVEDDDPAAETLDTMLLCIKIGTMAEVSSFSCPVSKLSALNFRV
jgi:hypothetical protein